MHENLVAVQFLPFSCASSFLPSFFSCGSNGNWHTYYYNKLFINSIASFQVAKADGFSETKETFFLNKGLQCLKIKSRDRKIHK